MYYFNSESEPKEYLVKQEPILKTELYSQNPLTKRVLNSTPRESIEEIKEMKQTPSPYPTPEAVASPKHSEEPKVEDDIEEDITGE